VRNQFGAILKGLLRCVPCGCAMTPSHTTKGDRRYRYYTCVGAQKRGWGTCPSKSIPAVQIERRKGPASWQGKVGATFSDALAAVPHWL
jgi:hypothetical protein